MATSTITFKVRMDWWLKVYLNTLIALCGLTGGEPNMERVEYWLKRGIKFEIAK